MSTDQTKYTISPRSNNYLIGHDEAENIFLQAWKSSNLHHAWLLCGLKGIGKATFAYKMAKFLLSADENKKAEYEALEYSEKEPIVSQITQDSCYNLKTIERDYTEEDKKKIVKAIKDGKALQDEDLAELKKSAVIKIDEVRTINEFFAKTSYDDKWRIVIVDSIDDMNINSANAFLKILEEPPAKSMLILISHNPEQLLPTIKSRCMRLDLHPLENNNIVSLLRRYRPDLPENILKNIASFSDGSIGKALLYADNDIKKYYDSLCKIILSGKNFKVDELLQFVEIAVSDEQSYNLCCDIILRLLSENIKYGENADKIIAVWEDILKIFEEATRINMDKKQVLLTVIYKICNAIG